MIVFSFFKHAIVFLYASLYSGYQCSNYVLVKHPRSHRYQSQSIIRICCDLVSSPMTCMVRSLLLKFVLMAIDKKYSHVTMSKNQTYRGLIFTFAY